MWKKLHKPQEQQRIKRIVLKFEEWEKERGEKEITKEGAVKQEALIFDWKKHYLEQFIWSEDMILTLSFNILDLQFHFMHAILKNNSNLSRVWVYVKGIPGYLHFFSLDQWTT